MPKKYIFTPAQVSDMVSRYTAGETCQSIAKRHGVDFPVARRVLLEADVYESGRRFAGRYSEAEKQQMVARYEAGESQKSIGEAFGCDRLNVRHILLRRGVTLRTERVPAMTAEQERFIREHRDAGENFANIARQLGVPPHRALRWARQLGISDFVGKSGPDSHAWKGGTTVHYGYVFERVMADDPHIAMARGNGYVAQHRLVMARSLGRDLSRSESVHHINGDRADNRLENLQLRQGNHGKGARFVCLDCGSNNVEAAGLS